MSDLAHLSDGRVRRGDPTKTAGIRRAFRAAAELRLRQLRAKARQAITEYDMLGLIKHDVPTFMTPAARLGAFSNWFESEARMMLAGSWPYEYLTKAIAMGEGKALQEVQAELSFNHGALDNLFHLSDHELKGIAGVVSQQVVRAAEYAASRRRKPAEAFRLIAGEPFKTGSLRLRAFANVMTVKSFITAKLEVYRANAVGAVGVVPEIKIKLPSHDHRLRDIKEYEPYDPYPEETDPEEDLVGVRTAEDDLVCQECEDYAEGAPYPIDEIELPLHVNCRCTVYPWYDQRFR